MHDVLELVVPWTVTTALLFVCLRYDERRLDSVRADRAWPPASRMSAVMQFAVVALVIHAWRTRRSVIGIIVGVALALGVLAVQYGVEVAIDALPSIDLGGSYEAPVDAAFELALFYAAYRLVAWSMRDDALARRSIRGRRPRSMGSATTRTLR